MGFDWHSADRRALVHRQRPRSAGARCPPDELNRAPRPGLHFGFPYCHGGWLRDPEFGLRSRCADFAAPAQNLGAHVASLGMRFYTGTQFPPGDHAWGRPVDVIVAPDGALLVSDDEAGAVYRIAYVGENELRVLGF